MGGSKKVTALRQYVNRVAYTVLIDPRTTQKGQDSPALMAQRCTE